MSLSGEKIIQVMEANGEVWALSHTGKLYRGQRRAGEWDISHWTIQPTLDRINPYDKEKEALLKESPADVKGQLSPRS